MENSSTDTSEDRVSRDEVDYWLTLDRTDMELSGLPSMYNDAEALSDALGVERDYEHKMLFRIRRRLAKLGDRF